MAALKEIVSTWNNIDMRRIDNRKINLKEVAEARFVWSDPADLAQHEQSSESRAPPAWQPSVTSEHSLPYSSKSASFVRETNEPCRLLFSCHWFLILHALIPMVLSWSRSEHPKKSIYLFYMFGSVMCIRPSRSCKRWITSWANGVPVSSLANHLILHAFGPVKPVVLLDRFGGWPSRFPHKHAFRAMLKTVHT